MRIEIDFENFSQGDIDIIRTDLEEDIFPSTLLNDPGIERIIEPDGEDNEGILMTYIDHRTGT